jgi:hypothetical protein
VTRFDWQTIAELVSAVTVVAGLVFAAVQVRQFREAREREVMLELVHSFETPEFSNGIYTVSQLPDGLDKQRVEQQLGASFKDVYVMITTFESLGILVYRGQVTLGLIDDFFSGPIVVAWRKLRGWVEAERRQANRDTYHEWFQWLAEQLSKRESSTPSVPAHIAHKDWRPPA